MWVLIFVLYIASNDTTKHTRLEVFDTLDDCTTEAEHLAEDMMTSYPGDTDTWFTCSLERV